MKNHNENHHHEGGQHQLELIIDGKPYPWHDQYITGRQVKELGSITEECNLFLAVPRPWRDEHIGDDDKVDLARTEPKPEHFYHRKKHEKVPIFIDDIKHEVIRGKHSVKELKSIGKIPEAYELKQLIDGRLVPLDDNAEVDIKCCEAFFGAPRSGKSS